MIFSNYSIYFNHKEEFKKTKYANYFTNHCSNKNIFKMYVCMYIKCILYIL